MSKILYPVGTEVQIRDFRIKQEKESTGVNWSNGKRVVIEYRQGDERPYVISTVDDLTKSASKRFSVDEIKSYRASNRSVGTDKTPQKSALESWNNDVRNKVAAPSTADVKEVVGQAVREALAEAEAERAERELEDQIIKAFAEAETEQEPTKMTASESIRKRIIYATKSKQERTLEENEILSGGYLTEQGRKVVLDLIWEGDADLRKAVYEAVLKATKKSKSKKSDCDDEE